MSDQERLQILLSQTVMLLCKNGLRFEKELRIQGLLGITIDHGNVFIVHFNESLAHTAADNAVATFSAQGSGNTVEITTSNVPFTVLDVRSVGKASSTDEAAKPRSPNTINHSQDVAIDRNKPPLRDEVTQVKVEQSSEMEADPVVLIESDTDEDTEATHLIATGHETSSQVWTQNVRKKCHPTKQSCSKRRPSALINSTPAYDDSNSATPKLEPASLPCTGSDDQNFEEGDSLSKQKWEDTSEYLSSITDQTISIEFPTWQPRETRSSGSNLRANAVNPESLPWIQTKGHHHDFAWRYFSKIRAKSIHGKKIFRAKCNICGKIQSNVLQRLRQHILVFHEMDLPPYRRRY